MTNSEATSIGYMPIVQALAHELDTLNTVMQRCRHIATALGQQHVVLTVDEALYCKLMELKWAKDEYQDFLIVRMGGLHISLTFLKVIGKHMRSSGLMEAWIESGLFGPGTAEQVILGKGKSYSEADLCDVLTAQITCAPSVAVEDLGPTATLIIDGQAVVCSIGKPQKAITFGVLADAFTSTVLQSGTAFKRIDVVFDRYYQTSIKSGTRTRHGQGIVAICQLIENRDVPLPPKWENFMAHPENKADVANFLSQQLILKAPVDKCIVVSGGFTDEERVESSGPTVITENIRTLHEEADTRIVLHFMENQSSSIVVAAMRVEVRWKTSLHFTP